jgi:hypothetical protein
MNNRNQNNRNKTINSNLIKLKPPQKPSINDNKRNHSSLSNSEPSSQKILQQINKKLFVTRNQFGDFNSYSKYWAQIQQMPEKNQWITF